MLRSSFWDYQLYKTIICPCYLLASVSAYLLPILLSSLFFLLFILLLFLTLRGKLYPLQPLRIFYILSLIYFINIVLVLVLVLLYLLYLLFFIVYLNYGVIAAAICLDISSFSAFCLLLNFSQIQQRCIRRLEGLLNNWNASCSHIIS